MYDSRISVHFIIILISILDKISFENDKNVQTTRAAYLTS
jgi:hypothetical protein